MDDFLWEIKYSDQKKNILIVDDSEVNLTILNNILKSDYHVTKTNNGMDALSILKDSYDNEFSAIILDLIMPVVNGYEVIKKIRETPKIAKIPILVISGKETINGENKELKALSLGANDYISKPYEPEVIKHRIANTIFLRETAAFVNMAQKDELTGFYNKEFFYSNCHKMISTLKEKRFDIICFDIEKFKIVNDIYGLSVGDKLLIFLTKLIKKNLPSALLYGRVGADKFACLIESKETSYDESFLLINKEVEQFPINLSISIKYGIYQLQGLKEPINIACDRAFLAIEKIKGKYDQFVSYYDEKLREELLQEKYIVDHMKKALENHEFEVYFQPKCDIKTGLIIGAESLVRWNDPEKGLILPSNFISIFERNGFIGKLDYYVWEETCSKISNWIKKGHKAIPVSVNVSRADIYNPELVSEVMKLLKKYDINTDILHLEITESAYTQNPNQLIKTVNDFKKLGFIIEMDDFGTGYSSLNMITELPIDILKLDIRFMENSHSSSNRSVLSFIISLAKILNLKVVVEGVENEEQLNLLHTLNCEYAQGFYFGKPMPYQDFEQKLFLQAKEYIYVKGYVKEENCSHKTSLFTGKGILFLADEKNEYDSFIQMISKDYEVYYKVGIKKAMAFLDELSKGICLCIFSCKDVFNRYCPDFFQFCNSLNIPILGLNIETRSIKSLFDLGMIDILNYPEDETIIYTRIKNIIQNSLTSHRTIEQQVCENLSQLKDNATKDKLTGLLNRVSFEKKVCDFFDIVSIFDCTLIIINITDIEGVGSVVLREDLENILPVIGDKIKKHFNETEVIARLGYDLFGVFIPYTFSKFNVERIAMKLKDEFSNCSSTKKISFNFGVAYSSSQVNNGDSLFQNALRLVEQNKSNKTIISYKE